MKHLSLYVLCALTLLSAPDGMAQGGLQKIFSPDKKEKKDRRHLERENELLRKRIKDLESELVAAREDSLAKDSLENKLEALYEEDEYELATGISPEDYDASVTDSLLNIWYLQRENQSLREGAGFNMDSVKYTTNVPDSVLIGRLARMNSFITLPYNETVKNCMILYSEKMPRKMANMLGLCSYYMPVFEETFRAYNLPLELKYVAIIESALNPRAVSRVKATGMWQFMYATARSYGLEINSYVDERLDPFRSVDAAARYFRDAYNIFGDWSLAISSYNCGSGNVNKAIKRAGGRRDFWAIYPHLPKETRGYVPLMVGAMYAINYAKEYGIEPTPTMLPARVDTFHVHRNLHFRQVSEVIGVPINDLRDLNPQYYRDIIPGNQGDYILRLPYYYSNDFLDQQETIYAYKADEVFKQVDVDKYGNTPSSMGVSTPSRGGTGEWVYYKVRSGDSLGKIASRNHVTVKQLQSWNGLRGTTIRAGQRLKVGRKSGSSARSASQGSSGSKSSGGYAYYTVRKGDTLFSIAKKHGVSTNEIMKANGIGENIRVGMKLKIPKH